MTTIFETRQQEINTLNQNIAKQTTAYDSAPTFNKVESKKTVDNQVKNNYKAVESKIEEDHKSIMDLSRQNKDLTIKVAELNHLLKVKDVETKFEVCQAQNEMATQVNLNLDPQKALPIIECKVVHCDAFNLEVTNYNTLNQQDILAGHVASHALADCQ